LRNKLTWRWMSKINLTVTTQSKFRQRVQRHGPVSSYVHC